MGTGTSISPVRNVVAIAPRVYDWTSLFNATTGWTVLGTDTVNLTTDLSHVLGTKSLEFDKTDGVANTKLAAVYRAVVWNLAGVKAEDRIVGNFFIPNKVDVDYAFVRLGTSVGAMNEWRYQDTSMIDASWNRLNVAVGDFTQTGAGIDWSSVLYFSVGVAFDAETDALADIYWNSVGIEQAPLMRT